MRLLMKLRRDQRAATAVEYGLILALIVIAMLTALRGFASNLIEMWDYVRVTVLST
jgi:pilus assembly protein Flp/PilA